MPWQLSYHDMYKLDLTIKIQIRKKKNIHEILIMNLNI